MADAKKLVAVRLSPAGLAYLDRLAVQEDVTRSEMIRRLLAEAVTARSRLSEPGH